MSTDGITISVTEDVTSVTVTEDVTTIDITPSVTTVEAKGIALGTAGAATATAYQNSNTNLAVGATVAASLDHINTNGFNKNADNTIDGNTTIAYDHTLNFTSGAVVKNAMNLGNNDITGVNHIAFADAGQGEGLRWSNIEIVETNDALTANSPGDLQVTYKQSDNSYARRFTVRDTGVDVVGTITANGVDITGNLAVDTDTLYVDSTNNRVGIGATNPSNQLTLRSTSAGDTSGIKWHNGTESVKAYFVNGNADSDFFITYTGTSGPEIKLKHSGDIVFNEGTTTGNVGINKNNPSTELDVTGTVTATAFAGPITGNVTGQVSDLSNHTLFDGAYSSLSGKPTLFDGEYASLNNKPTLYTDAAVDTHLNQSTAANNEVLSWNGTDYDWVPQSGGISLSSLSVSGTEGTALGDGGIAYNNSTGVFTYTPPDLSSYLTSAPVTSVDGNTGAITTLQLGTSGTTAMTGNTALSAIGGSLDLASQVTGTLPVGNMAATALTTVQTAADQAAQLALTTEEGDVVVRTDENKTYMRNSGTTDPHDMSNFTLLATPTDAVTSVDGNTGAVTTLQIGTGATTALAGNTTIADLGGQASLTFGIADTNAVKVDHDGVADDDYAKFTANGIEGRSADEVKTDLSLNNVENTAVSSFAGSANITTVGTVSTGTWQGTAIADAYISSASTWNGKQDALTFGIADTNAVKVDHDGVADDDYAKFTANGIEGRSASEVLTDIGAQPVLSEGAFANGDKTKLNNVELNDPEFDSVILDNPISTTNWTIEVDNSGSLVFKYGTNTRMKLTLSGELVVDDDITAFGTI